MPTIKTANPIELDETIKIAINLSKPFSIDNCTRIGKTEANIVTIRTGKIASLTYIHFGN
jgi:hypothetical protein